MLFIFLLVPYYVTVLIYCPSFPESAMHHSDRNRDKELELDFPCHILGHTQQWISNHWHLYRTCRQWLASYSHQKAKSKQLYKLKLLKRNNLWSSASSLPTFNLVIKFLVNLHFYIYRLSFTSTDAAIAQQEYHGSLWGREIYSTYWRTCEAMNNSGSPPHTCGFLICETYTSKSPSTNLWHSKVITYNSIKQEIQTRRQMEQFPQGKLCHMIWLYGRSLSISIRT